MDEIQLENSNYGPTKRRRRPRVWTFLLGLCLGKTTALVVPSNQHSLKRRQGNLANQPLCPAKLAFGSQGKGTQCALSKQFPSRKRGPSRLKASPVSLASSSGGLAAWWYMALLALQFACQPLLTKTFATGKLVKTTYVVAQDILRFLVCAGLLTLTSSWSTIASQWTFVSSLIAAGLPASLYAIQNYCSLMAYQNLSPISYNVLNQTKTLSAAFFCYFLLSKPQSKFQIVALFLLLGSALIMEEIIPIRTTTTPPTTINNGQEDKVDQLIPLKKATHHFTRGVLPILLASLISGLAGTLCQQSLQEFGRNPLLFSMEISVFSSLFLVSSLFTGNPDGRRIAQGGVTQGWTRETWIPLVCNALGGILVGLVTKYAGSVRKGFALVIGLLLSGLLQNRSSTGVSIEQWAGGGLAAVAIWMHVSIPH